MSNARREHHKQVVAELAETAMALARSIAEKALAAESVEQTIELTQAYERVARSVRLSIDLCEKLDRHDRDDARAARADRYVGFSVHGAARQRQHDDRVDAVRAAVRRSIEQECEGEDSDAFEAALELALEEAALNDGFDSISAGQWTAVLRKKLGLPEHLTLDVPDPRPTPS
jgi:hypothetical protein